MRPSSPGVAIPIAAASARRAGSGLRVGRYFEPASVSAPAMRRASKSMKAFSARERLRTSLATIAVWCRGSTPPGPINPKVPSVIWPSSGLACTTAPAGAPSRTGDRKSRSRGAFFTTRAVMAAASSGWNRVGSRASSPTGERMRSAGEGLGSPAPTSGPALVRAGAAKAAGRSGPSSTPKRGAFMVLFSASSSSEVTLAWAAACGPSGPSSSLTAALVSRSAPGSALQPRAVRAAPPPRARRH